MTVGHVLWPDQLTPEEVASLRPGAPRDLDRAPDVLVVGGGIVGCATAAACVQAGLGSVVLLERDALGAGASGGAAGLLVPESHVGVDPPEFVAAMRQSLGAWRNLESSWPGGVGLLPLDWHGQPQARVNPLRAIARLAKALPCVASGVDVSALRTEGGRVVGVATSAGEFRPRRVVFATGLPPRIAGVDLGLGAGEVLRAGEVKGHMLCTAPTALASRPASDQMDLATLVEDGRVLMGGTLDVGDDARVVRSEVTEQMRRELVAAWPALEGVAVDYAWACFRPAHADHLPVVDRLPGLHNAWLTSGHYKTGILMAAGTGQALAEWLASGAPPPGVEPFRLARPTLRG